MTKENFKKGLIGLGIGAIITAGVAGYFLQEKKEMSWGEYVATIEEYNKKIEEIKKDCDNDKRCDKGKVIFQGVKTRKDVLDKMNKWIEDDIKDPKTYKKK